MAYEVYDSSTSWCSPTGMYYISLAQWWMWNCVFIGHWCFSTKCWERCQYIIQISRRNSYIELYIREEQEHSLQG